jgi:hypothetical protein
MSEGRWPLLLHSRHPLWPFSSSPRANARPSVKLFHATRSLPSQSGHEIQPSSRYVRSGRPGMSEGRCPLLLHAYHPLLPFSSSPRASALREASADSRHRDSLLI